MIILSKKFQPCKYFNKVTREYEECLGNIRYYIYNCVYEYEITLMSCRLSVPLPIKSNKAHFEYYESFIRVKTLFLSIEQSSVKLKKWHNRKHITKD